MDSLSTKQKSEIQIKTQIQIYKYSYKNEYSSDFDQAQAWRYIQEWLIIDVEVMFKSLLAKNKHL